MRRVLEATQGRLHDSVLPSISYLSDKLEEVELNDPQASQLTEVTSMEDVDAQSLGAAVDITGRITVTKTKNKVKMPGNSEEFRLRMRIEANLWLCLSAKHANRSWLVGLTMKHWQAYIEFFLGRKVMLLEVANGGSDSTAVRPEWITILNFEFQCRKDAFRQVREDNITLHEALALVQRNSELKELHFLSPLMLMGRKRPNPGKGDPPEGEKLTKKQRQAKAKAAKGAAKGDWPKATKGAKGAAKGAKGASDQGDLVSATPDGRKICFAYNSRTGCTRPSCSMLHVCRKKGCQEVHPLQDHPE